MPTLKIYDQKFTFSKILTKNIDTIVIDGFDDFTLFGTEGWTRYQIENEKISILKELGLEVNEGSLFSVPMEDSSYSLIQWINEHTEDLQRKGFKVEQDFTEVNYYLGKIELKIKVNQIGFTVGLEICQLKQVRSMKLTNIV